MAYCTNCGAEVARDQGFCGNCGADVSATAGEQRGGQDQGSGSPSAAGAPPSSGGPPGNGAPPGSETPLDGGSGRYSRRKLLAGGGLAVLGVGGAAGYVVLSNEDSPDSAAETYLTALQNGNTPKANSLRHGDASRMDVSPRALPVADPSNARIQSVQVESESGNRVTVVATIAESSGSAGADLRIRLRKQGNEWRVHGWGPVGMARSFIRALNQGETEAANSMFHENARMEELGSFQASIFEDAEVSIESAELNSEAAQTATVSMELTMTYDGQTQTSNGTVDLRKQDGKWRIDSMG